MNMNALLTTADELNECNYPKGSSGSLIWKIYATCLQKNSKNFQAEKELKKQSLSTILATLKCLFQQDLIISNYF